MTILVKHAGGNGHATQQNVITRMVYLNKPVLHLFKILAHADKLNTVSCPTPGCRGIGHVKGAKYTTHHSQFGCPYSLQNLSKESCLVDRLAANSMAEDSDWSYERRKNSFGKQSKGT
jgi:hypothetical protein